MRLAVMIAAACAALLLSAAVAGAAPAVGYRPLVVASPIRGTDIEVGVWYPAADGPASGSAERLVGATPLFIGTRARPEASVAAGQHPLLVLAHGGLRSARHLGDWLAADLAARGYIVAAVQPADFDAGDPRAVLREFAARPADLSAAVSAMRLDPFFAPFLQAERVAVVGLLRGATSALALLGGRIDAGRYVRSCEAVPNDPDCRWFARVGLTFAGADVTGLGDDRSDLRIGAVIAVAPELTNFLVRDDLTRTGRPVTVIALPGVPGSASDDLAGLLPSGRLLSFAGATLYSLFPLCTDIGPALLREDGEDETLCGGESGHASRQRVHDRLVAMIAEALEPYVPAR